MDRTPTITLVVLAAGLGSRYGRDKQLERVGRAGELLLEYALHDALQAGCTRAVLVTRESLVEQLAAALLPAWRARLDLRIAVQRSDEPPAAALRPRLKPWGTAHALLAARPHVPGDLLVCNADDFYGRGGFHALVAALREGGGHALAGYPLGDTLSPHGGVSRAVCHVAEGGRLLRVEERTGIERRGRRILDDRGRELAADTPVSMNLWAFRASIFVVLERAFGEFVATHGGQPGAELRIPDVVNADVAAGAEVRVAAVREQWFGMTYAADRPAVAAALAARVAAGEYPANLRQPGS